MSGSMKGNVSVELEDEIVYSGIDGVLVPVVVTTVWLTLDLVLQQLQKPRCGQSLGYLLLTAE